MTNWEELWKVNNIRWDQGDVTPAITQFLAETPTPLGESVIVPGCGMGYDVLAFAKAGYKSSLGLDMAPTSTAQAKAHAAKDDHPLVANAHFETGDFFEIKNRQFDLLFDYTFACAIEPSLRDAWAAQVAALIKPGGYALILMFPLRDSEGGPPYKWSVMEYSKYLEPNFEVVYIKECGGQEDRKAIQRISLWKRRSTTFNL
ncbi:hypothetical protein BATDEDRAFT_84793 [Batrachochytrium dendrobatidis JAM81]|uniref:Thiopurine S-methyltransferase n=2 Tax=Batrachochytrium dendrobatidis TaxID=109871 RepID=F4NV82_BATDJ|nr:uncharacterized protein BATDEDRAFT_84793 [Batrachochytrium dendrobatidis JAM81]EGF83244.1 hypothetical protein BATDEDRAFT_84793 [Batrachochytrium dendrobatidis JAM81]KAJ8325580.1 hypothetical protein O5D80_005789 [Batrachochytrium dendrobatidis]KAK5671439.1 hypothetical protein QVD99_002151 [Batrachochytrium dendrobatidis]OAJ36548.1 hypothetical protein BDEG_20711 [Batrachochytrium dendrobatidis JEL423]|eukprot:XP_006676032.1 hypothetical protein BATDEDRAFT_84793 [Batrachochytrium dendrobatidis JAM81]